MYMDDEWKSNEIAGSFLAWNSLQIEIALACFFFVVYIFTWLGWGWKERDGTPNMHRVADANYNAPEL